MVAAPERQSKLSPKFTGPYHTTQVMGRNKYQIFNEDRDIFEIYLSDSLKQTKAETARGFNVQPFYLFIYSFIYVLARVHR